MRAVPCQPQAYRAPTGRACRAAHLARGGETCAGLAAVSQEHRHADRAHKTLDTPEGIIRYYEFKDVSDQAYYAKKRELLELLRDRLKEHVDNGTLMSCGLEGKPPLGVWHELLLPEERKELAALYWECSWNAPSYKRKTPPLWDMPEGVDPTDKALPDYRSASEAVPEREIVPEGTVIKPADPDAVENWLAGGSL